MEKYFRNLELKRLKYSVDYIKTQQNSGNYPLEFKMPLGVQYELTATCNLSCLHCYNRSGDNDRETLMSPQDWVDLSHHITENGGVFQCIISGGEPLLLGDNLIRVMDVLDKDGTGFVLITNGYLVNEEWIKKLKKYKYFWVQVSIDSCYEKEHDKFRGKEGSWARAVEAAHLISGAGLPLVIANSVIPSSIPSMNKMAELAYKLGASSIIFGEVMPSGRAVLNKHILLTKNQKDAMYKNIFNIQKEFLGQLEIQYGSSITYGLNYRKAMPNRAVIIRPNGDVRLDCIAPFTIGNVKQTPFSEIWKSKAIQCWSDQRITDYINGFNQQTGINPNLVNHVNEDVQI